MAIGLLVLMAAPALSFAVGGMPRIGRVGLAVGDITNLQVVAGKLVAGVTPYSRGFHGHVPFIYPPGILAFMMAPLLGDPNHYVLAFALEMLALVIVLCVTVSAWSARARGLNSTLSWSVLALLCAAGPLTLYRVDPVIGLLLLAAALAWRDHRMTLAFLLVFTAGLIKDYAWVELLPLAAFQLRVTLHSRGAIVTRLVHLASPVVLGLLPALMVLAVFEVWSGGGLLRSQLHNLDRGVEIESLPAGLAMVIACLKGVLVSRGALGSMQISGARLHLGLVVGLFALLGMAALAITAALVFRGRLGPGSAFGLSLGAAMLATPVLSPQYIDALTPCLVLAAVELGSTLGPFVLWGSLGCALLTQMEFPYLWVSVQRLQPASIAILELRNLLLVALVGLLLATGLVLGGSSQLTANSEEASPVR